jgi:hypothetical protein
VTLLGRGGVVPGALLCAETLAAEAAAKVNPIKAARMVVDLIRILRR